MDNYEAAWNALKTCIMHMCLEIDTKQEVINVINHIEVVFDVGDMAKIGKEVN